MSRRSPVELAAWQDLGSGHRRQLTDRIDATLPRDGHPTPAQLTAWRKDAGIDIAAAAVELVRARRASGWKFRDLPDPRFPPVRDLLLDVHGGEQATSWRIARQKALRFADRVPQGATVVDACCGVGADARELAAAGLTVRAVDLDPLRAWMCGHNSACAAEVADATTLDVRGMFLHIDPGRREESRSGARARLRSLDDLHPPIGAVANLASAARGAAVKLGPGVDLGELPVLDVFTSLEYISLDGQLSQAVWWTGDLAAAPSRGVHVAARVIRPNETFVISSEVDLDRPDTGEHPIGTHIYTVDPAVERARLLGALAESVGLVVLHPGLGLLTDALGHAAAPLEPHPALIGFVVRHVMGWRRDHVARWLAEHDAGIVEVKTRAKACDPDVEQASLRGGGTTPFAAFVLRFGDAVRAIITERLRPA
jgi:SAM-dependent methyltransferase